MKKNWRHLSTVPWTKPGHLNKQPTEQPTCLWAGECQLYRLRTPANTQTHSSSLTHSLYHITLPPTGQTMNLHSERYGQRRRTGPRLHNDCSESVLVMWFVTPSALPLMWLRDGALGRPCQMRWWPPIGEAEQKPGSAWLVCNLSHRTRENRIGEHDDWEDVGGLLGRVYLRVCVCLNELNGFDRIFCTYSHFSLLQTNTHINLSTSHTLCII